jgi:hypothetical protein
VTQPLGLKPADEATYAAFITTRSHDFAISVDIMKLDHTAIRSVTDQFIDGQVNLASGQPVERTATFTFYDPDRSMHIDPDTPWESATFADRMIRVQHTVNVPGLGRIVATPFVGPVTKVSRDGDTIDVECQDKASLAITGTSPLKCKKGMDAVAAIRHVMQDGAGENKFRLPNGLKRNLHKTFNVGWTSDAAPWVVAQRIAAEINHQLLYSCDGYLTLRPLPQKVAALSVSGTAVTTSPQTDFDASSISNIVRVTGKLAPPRAKKAKPGAKPQLETPPTTISAVAVAAPTHPLSPSRLGRNGVSRYLPTIIDGSTYKSLSQARALATTTLQHDLPLTVGVTLDMVPVFHLDVGDLINVQTPVGRVVVRFIEGSIPLGISGDMSIGQTRRVSEGRGLRTSGHTTHHAATKQERKTYHAALKTWQKSHHHHG